MAGCGDLGFYIGSYTSDANATAFLTSRGYTQALGYEYWDSVNSQLKKWDGTGWGVITGAGATSPWRTTAGAIHPATPGTDDVAVAAAAMAGTERFRVNAASLMDKADAGADPVLTVQASASHPVAQPVLMIDQDLTTMTAAGLLIDSEVGASGAPLIELQPLNTNTRGDIAFGATRTGDPAGIATTGDLWYNQRRRHEPVE
jgi:hypothetical protein